MSGRLKAIVGVLVGLLILAVWLHLVGLEETLAALTAVAPGPAIVATAAWAVAMVLRAWKWHTILAPTQRVSFLTSGRVYWVSSFLNVIFPFRVGELARSLFLKRLAEIPVAVSLPTVLVDRLYSVAVMLVGLLFLPLTSFRLEKQASSGGAVSASAIRWGIGVIACGFLATLALLFALRHQRDRILGLGARALRFLPENASRPMLGFLGAAIESMQVVRSGAGSAVMLAVLSVAVLVADALKDHYVLQAFGLHVPIVECFFGVCLTNLAFILPSPPGNIGSTEWYATLVYSTGFGYNGAQVASGALFGHVMTTVVVVGAGALSLSSLGLGLAEGLRISQSRSES